MIRVRQKYVRFSRYLEGDMWILGESGGTSYLASQCAGESGLEKDLAAGWIVKHCWEDMHQLVFLLEKNK